MASPPYPPSVAPPNCKGPHKRAGAVTLSLLAALLAGSWLGFETLARKGGAGIMAALCSSAPPTVRPVPFRLDEAACILITQLSTAGHPLLFAFFVGSILAILWLPWLTPAAYRLGRRWPAALPGACLLSWISVCVPLTHVVLAAALAFAVRSFVFLQRRGAARDRLASALALALLLVSTRQALPALLLFCCWIVTIAVRERGWAERAATILTLLFPAFVLFASESYLAWALSP